MSITLPSFDRFTIQKLKYRNTLDGGFVSADCLLDGKKIATFLDAGDGSPSVVEFLSDTASASFEDAVTALDLRPKLRLVLMGFFTSPDKITLDRIINIYIDEAVNALIRERNLAKLKKKTDMALVAENGQMMVWAKGVTLASVAKANVAALQRTYDRLLRDIPETVKVVNTVAELQSLGLAVQPARHIA